MDKFKKIYKKYKNLSKTPAYKEPQPKHTIIIKYLLSVGIILLLLYCSIIILDKLSHKIPATNNTRNAVIENIYEKYSDKFEEYITEPTEVSFD